MDHLKSLSESMSDPWAIVAIDEVKLKFFRWRVKYRTYTFHQSTKYRRWCINRAKRRDYFTDVRTTWKSFHARNEENERVENKNVNTLDDLSLTFVLLFIESSDRLLSCTCHDLISGFLLRCVLLYNATSVISSQA